MITIAISPSMENPPNKPTNLFLDTSKVNANGISAKLCSILGLWFGFLEFILFFLP